MPPRWFPRALLRARNGTCVRPAVGVVFTKETVVTWVLRPAIFLDRDGVINANRSDYVKSWAECEILPGSQDALRRLAALHWPVVVVTNQSPIGRGILSMETVEEINTRLVTVIAEAGGRIDLVVYCPHHPEAGCGCRKPQPGLLLYAANALGIDLGHSYLVGDAESDVLAAQAAGVYPILVLSGRGEHQLTLLREHKVDHFHVVADLSEAVTWILAREE